MTVEQVDTPPQTVATPTPAATVFTLETLLWALLALAALGVRLVQLGTLPLSEAESAMAYEAWRFSTGNAPELTRAGVNPFAFNLNSLLFYLFGAGDGVARVGSVVAGTLLVLSAWLYRPLLGRGHALGMALLLALSPSVLFFSRDATGAIWGLLFASLFAAGVARWRESGARRELLFAVAALALGLTADGGFWSVLVAGGLTVLFATRRSPAAADAETPVMLNGARAPLPFTPYALAGAGALLFLLVATHFGTNLAGLGAAFNQPVQWLLRLFSSGASLALPFFFVFLLYELLAVLFGVIGGILLLDRKPLWAIFGFVWLGVNLIPAALLNSGWAGALPYMVFPLALLGGGVLSQLAEKVARDGSWRIDGASLLVTFALLLYFWISFNLYLYVPEPIKLIGIFVPFAGAALGVAYLYVAHNPATAWRVGGVGLFVVLAIASVASGWGVSISRANDPREPLVVFPSDANMRTVASELAQVSLERYRDPYAIPLGIERSLGYAPRWYFRQFRDVTGVTGNTDLPEAALLARSTAPAEGIGQLVYIGQTWQWTQPDPLVFLRWLKSRNDSAVPPNREAVLYVRMP